MVKVLGRYVRHMMDPTQYVQQLIGMGKRVQVRSQAVLRSAWDFRQG